MSECFVSLLAYNYDIYALSETWLCDGVFNSEFVPATYNVLRCDRDFQATGVSRGGGVLFAIKTGYNYEQIPISDDCRLACPSLDILACKVHMGSIIVVFIVVYVPKTPSTSELNTILGFFEEICLLYEHVFVCGDFNIPTYVKMSNSDPLYTLISDFANFTGLKQYNHIKNADDRILDLVMTSISCDVTREFDPLVREDPRHPPLSVLVRFDSVGYSNFPTTCDRPRYNFRKANLVALYDHMRQLNWNFLLNVTNVDEACSLFYDSLYSLLDIYVPRYRSKKKTRQFPHWFNHHIVNMIYVKEGHYKRYVSSGDIYYLNLFKKSRAKVKSLIREAHDVYLRGVSNRFKTDPREVWRYVRGRKSESRIPGKLIYNDVPCDTPDSVVDAFKSFFSSVFSSPDPQSDIPAPLASLDLGSFDFIVESELLTAASKLKGKLTAGTDQIPDFFVKDCIRVLTIPLLHIFNTAIRASTFPAYWKSARICPIYKSGDAIKVENYRPVAVLPSFSKLFEIVLQKRIYDSVGNSISRYQHGFIQGRSTVTNLCCFTQYCADVIDDCGQVDVVYLDLSKAFDKVNHYLLLDKLLAFGLPAYLLSLIRSYLLDRRSFVEYNGFRSSEFIPASGVPQGSNLGPLLFCLYVNDLPDRILTSHKLLFADDIKIFHRIINQCDHIALQNDLDTINNWCNENCLSLNPDKCSVMSISRKRIISTFNYALDDAALHRVDSVMDLGVTFDCELRFDIHVFKACATANKTLGFLLRTVGGFAERDVLIILFSALVRSRLDYASVVWDPLYNIYSTSLESIQRRFLKYLFYKKYRVYPVQGYDHTSLLREFGLRPLSMGRESANLKFLYKLVHRMIDCDELYSKLQFYTPRPASRSHHQFYNVRARTNVMIGSPIYRMCCQMNRVSHSVDINSDSLRHFVDGLGGVLHM